MQLERLRATVGALLEHVGLPKGRLVQQRVLFEKTKAAFETRLAEAKARFHAERTKTTTHRYRLGVGVDWLSSNQNALGTEFSRTPLQLAAVKTELRIVSEQLTQQKTEKEDVEQKKTDVQYELDGAKARIRQFLSHESCAQAGVDRILKQTGQMRAAFNGFKINQSITCSWTCKLI